MAKFSSILFLVFSLLIASPVNLLSQKKEASKKVNTKKSKSNNSKNKKGQKEIDAYFYGGKDKKGKNKKGKKGKDGKESDKIVDTKSILKEKGGSTTKKTSGGKAGTSETGLYRPVYVGNKIVTGKIQEQQGFRICIYTGTNRVEALKLKVDFMKQFQNIRSYMSYNTPYYKIKVGDYADKKEAQKVLKQIVIKFPAAFIVPDVVTVKNLMIYKNY